MALLVYKDGKWLIKGSVRDWNAIYRDAYQKYLNCIGPLFEKAKAQSEFEFILTLLRVKSLQDAGWDPWKSTLKTFDLIVSTVKKARDFIVKRNLSLWLYGHIIEASEPYEITADLINVASGKRYKIKNFPNKSQPPSQKIDELSKMAKTINIPESIFPFKDVYDRGLRNSVFHSDYSLYGGEVRTPNESKKKYKHEEVEALINKSLAHFETFKHLMQYHISSYRQPVAIPVHPDFSKDPQEKAVTIIRKGFGLIGLKDSWMLDEIKKGKITFRIGNFMRYEKRMLDKNKTLCILPHNRIEGMNNLLRKLPKFISRKIVNYIEKNKIL